MAKSKKAKKTDKVYRVIENSQDVDIIKDFWNIHQMMRENSYLLDGIKEKISSNVYCDSEIENKMFFIKSNKETPIYVVENKQETISDFIEEIDKLQAIYNKYEEELFDGIEKNEVSMHDIVFGEVAIAVDEAQDIPCNVANKNRELNTVEKFYFKMKSYISLSEEMEELAYKALAFLYECRIELNEQLSSSDNELILKFAFKREQRTLELLLDSNVDRDKIVNYIFTLNIDDEGDEIKKQFDELISKYGKDRCIKIKKKDKRYVIDKIREYLSNESCYTDEIISNSISRKQTIQIERLNKILLSLAILSPIISLVGFMPTFLKIEEIHGLKTLIEVLIGFGIIVIALIVVLIKFVFRKR